MEKFTVDLEKVLDDFEFSEERDERTSSASKDNVTNPISLVTNYEYPPREVYKRPAFEQINLADADYSAAVTPSREAESQSYPTNTGSEISFPVKTSPHPNAYLSSIGNIEHPNSYRTGHEISTPHTPVRESRHSNQQENHSPYFPSADISQHSQSYLSSTTNKSSNENICEIKVSQQIPYPMSRDNEIRLSQDGAPSCLTSTDNDISTSYVFPNMSSGANVIIQKRANSDISTGTSIEVPKSTTPNMSSGSHVIQKSMDYILSPQLLDSGLNVTEESVPSDLSTENVLSSSSESGDTPSREVKPDGPPEPRQSLPDVATAARKPSERFDLINDRVMNAIVDSSSSDAKPVAIGFHAVCKPVLSESELNKYLDELDDEMDENSVEEVSSLPVVSTDDEISSSQSQVDENSSSVTTCSGHVLGGENNEEFENLLSPESSTGSFSHTKVDATNESNQVHAELHAATETDQDVKLDVTNNTNLPNSKPDAADDERDSHSGSANVKMQIHPDIENKDKVINDSNSGIDTTELNLLENVTSNADENQKLEEHANNLFKYDSDKSEQIDNIDKENFSKDNNDESSKDSKTKYEEQFNISSKEQIDIHSNFSEDDVTSISLYNEPSTDHLNSPEHTNKINTEPCEQNKCETLNSAEEQSTHIYKEEIKTDRYSDSFTTSCENNASYNLVETAENVFETAEKNRGTNQASTKEFANKNTICENKPIENYDKFNESTEIINTNYVVEISRPRLVPDPKNASPNKNESLVPDNFRKLSSSAFSETPNVKEAKFNTINEIDSPHEISNSNENSMINSKEIPEDSKDTIQHVLVKNNLKETDSYGNMNSPKNSYHTSEKGSSDHETSSNKNLSEKTFHNELKRSNEDFDVNMYKEINITNTSNKSPVETIERIAIEGTKASKNFSANSNIVTTQEKQNNFVHNDLEIVREKNTNISKNRKETANVASVISVSNLKQDPKVISQCDSNVSTSNVSGATNSNMSTNSCGASSSIPNISISIAPPTSSIAQSCYNVVSPDCYSEEKFIANSIKDNVCDSTSGVAVGGSTAQVTGESSELSENRPVHEASTSKLPSNPTRPPESFEHPPGVCSPQSGPKPVRPNSLDLPSSPSVSLSPSETPPNLSDSEPAGTVAGQTSSVSAQAAPSAKDNMLGRRAPYWVPDTEAPACMQCQVKFTLVKRRHHCRACGQVLCSKCCYKKAGLEYLQYAMERVCLKCYDVLVVDSSEESGRANPVRQPNPNNPMEYCSTIPPLQQIAESGSQPPPSVLVPVSVLKREGSLKSREGSKQVMFSDGIKPGGDLTELDAEREVSKLPISRKNKIKRVGTPPGSLFNKRPLHPDSNSFIPSVGLPPVIVANGADISYSEITSPLGVNEPSVKFAIHRNLFAHVKKIRLDCCLGKKRVAWNITSEGLSCVGQDEVVFLLACTQGEVFPPQHMFHVILHIYSEASQGSTVTEMCFLPSPPAVQELLGSKDHGGFIFIRRASQCLTHLTLPDPPYLFGVLVHRWEIPWAKLFPLRLVLRLGASLKSYPCPLLSVRFREPVFIDVGHTIIKLLADFRSYAYTLPNVRGLLIHMEENKTSVVIPKNFYEQVVKAMNLSNESHLAFAGNFSAVADSYLVCVQNVEAETSEYSTQRIECPGANTEHSCTGLAFILFNASLKTSDGMQGKACIHEDGLMVHLLPEGMVALRAALHDMRNYIIPCGPQSEESVHIVWGPQDLNFNVGVRSCIDGKPLDGVQSIRVHGGTDYTGAVKMIRWTEVFIVENNDLNTKTTEDPIDYMKKLSENISRATCISLVPLLDSLATTGESKFAVRVTIHPDNVGYEAGMGGQTFDAKYMRHLDEGLIPVVHHSAVNSSSPLTLELVFRIMEQG